MEGRTDPRLLKEAFDTFWRTSLQLQRYYRTLEARVKELTEELERSRRQREEMALLLEGVMESLTAGVVVVEGGKVVSLNGSAEEIIGLERGEVLGRDFSAVLPREWLDAEEAVRDFRAKRIRVISSPLRGRDGQVVVLEDVTELEKWRRQAMRVEGLSAMGEVAAQLAHQIRNPLGVIKLFASLLTKELHGDHRAELAHHLLKGVGEIEAVVSNLLLFIRPQKPALKAMDLREPLAEVLSFVKRFVAENGIRLETSISAEPLLVRGDAELLKQVFYNLVLNAVEAMPEGGTLRVGTGRRSSRLKGEVAEVTIADSGCGIPSDKLQEVFKPFYTTKDKGTGLGLTIAHRIVEVHGGLIEVESEEGNGTTFRISLPLLRASETTTFEEVR